jgi:hypothetical protein
MGYTLFPPEPASDAVIHSVIALAPMVLLTVVARRMKRGWFISSLPWLLVALAAAVYSAAAVKLFVVNGLRGTLLLFAHLVVEVGPFITILSLAVLAVLGAKKASNKSEPV